MNSKEQEITLLRTANGWIVRPRSSYSDVSVIADMHVARTPGQLVELVLDWAAAQHKDETK